MKIQTFQLLAAIIPIETAQFWTQIHWVHNQPETKGSDQCTKHPQFFNKGNTCYGNSILQSLSTIPSFWCQLASESDFLSLLIRAVTLNMSLLKRQTTPLDPSNFLWAFCRILSTNKQVPFQFNTQQDAPEILKVVLDELKGHSTAASNSLVRSVRTSTTCDTCGCCNIKETRFDRIPLPLAKSISLFLDMFFLKIWPEATNGFAQHVMDLWTVEERPKLLNLGAC